MILEYSFNNANEVLDLIKHDKIVSLNVEKVGEEKYVMDYKLFSSLEEEEKAAVRLTMSKSIPERMRLIEVFNSFLEHMITKTVDSFRLSYTALNVSKSKLNYNSIYRNVFSSEALPPIKPVLPSKETPVTFSPDYDNVETLFDMLDKIMVEKGISTTPSGLCIRAENGKRKNYSKVSIHEAIEVLKKNTIGE